MEAFFEHTQFPTRAQQEELAAQLHTTVPRIRIWFQNQRQRSKPRPPSPPPPPPSDDDELLELLRSPSDPPPPAFPLDANWAAFCAAMDVHVANLALGGDPAHVYAMLEHHPGLRPRLVTELMDLNTLRRLPLTGGDPQRAAQRVVEEAFQALLLSASTATPTA